MPHDLTSVFTALPGSITLFICVYADFIKTTTTTRSCESTQGLTCVWKEQSPSDQVITQRWRTCCAHSSMFPLRPVVSRYCISQVDCSGRMNFLMCELTNDCWRRRSAPFYFMDTNSPCRSRLGSTSNQYCFQPPSINRVKPLDISIIRRCRHALHCMGGLIK
ncbi:hypothetical protein EDD16DRAFT_1659751 [Pisolithus croceorrhizus]|nr:hypothetical protein EDD16DRAFT_1659751 [Pisolithus croceorrhizus]